MPNFVTDLTTLAFPKADARAPTGSTSEVTASNWNDLCQAAIDLRGAVVTLQNTGVTQWTTSGNNINYTPIGNVGIATASPAEKLHVTGNTRITGDLGVGTSGSAGQKVHISNGNVLIDGSAENGFMVKRNGTVGTSTDPFVTFGRLYSAGIGEPAGSIFWNDSTGIEHRTVSFEKTGTWAVIGDGERRSAYETFRTEGSVHPDFRLSSYPKMGVEFGSGGAEVLVGGMTRAGTTVTVETVTEHNMEAGQTFTLSPGEANYAAGSFTIASVPDGTHFTFTQAGTTAASTARQVVSCDTDVRFQRVGWKCAGIAVNNADKILVYEDAVVIQSGVKLVLGSSDASGTPGAATINQPSGTVAIAAGSSSVVVTNWFANASARIFAQIHGAADDATLTQITRISKASGSFTIHGNANATAPVKIDFFIVS